MNNMFMTSRMVAHPMANDPTQEMTRNLQEERINLRLEQLRTTMTMIVILL